MSGATEVLSRGIYLSGNEKDYNHVSDPQYIQERNKADEAYSKKVQLTAQSQKAYRNGDKKTAHDLSIAANQQVQIATEHNRKAAEYVFVENNLDSDNNDIDLHGLYIKEAQYILKQRIINGIQRGEPTLDCIVGKGLHSKNGISKLKPAVEELCQEANIKSYVDKKNTGVLHIDIRNAKIPSSWSDINPNGIGAMAENYNRPPVSVPQSSYQKPPSQVNQHQQQQQEPYYQQQQPIYQQPQQQQQQQQQNQGSSCNPAIQSLLFGLCSNVIYRLVNKAFS